jgi:hypothetical protein
MAKLDRWFGSVEWDELHPDASLTVPVPCFLLFLCFRKATQEIFSELDETKVEPPIFPEVS